MGSSCCKANAVGEQLLERIQRKLDANPANPPAPYSAPVDLTSLPAADVRRLLLTSGANRATLEQVFWAFHLKRRQAGNHLRAFADVFVERPLALARDMDRDLKNLNEAEATIKYPGLGLVISLKETLKYKDSLHTMGIPLMADLPAKKSAGLFDYLESRGTLIISKGNCPDFVSCFDSVNRLYGTAVHPKNHKRSPGGSSSGEAVLVATGLVQAAIGTDLGGSVRVPSLFCGLYGIRPTAGRWDTSCIAKPFEGHEHEGLLPDGLVIIPDTIGTIARTLSDLELISREVNGYSANLHPIPWNKAAPPKRVGYIVPHPAFFRLPDCTRRVFEIAKQRLVSAGVELVPIDLSRVLEEMVPVIIATYLEPKQLKYILDKKSPDKGPFPAPVFSQYEYGKWLESQKNGAKGASVEPPLHPTRLFAKGYAMVADNNYSTLLMLANGFRDRAAAIVRAAGVTTYLEYGAIPAPLLGQCHKLDSLFYNFWSYNYLNWPSGVVPISVVEESEQHYSGSLTPDLDQLLAQTMQGSAGLPIGVQVVGLPWQEEAIFETMRLIDHY